MSAIHEQFGERTVIEGMEITAVASLPNEDIDAALCQICGDGTAFEENNIVLCDGCNCCVHEACYGIETLPPGDDPWFCELCAPKHSLKTRCELCKQVGGAMRRLDSGNFAHVLCARFVLKSDVSRLRPQQPMGSLSAAQAPPAGVGCGVCRQVVGYPVKCSESECTKYFHPSCALNTDEATVNAQDVRLWCRVHGAETKTAESRTRRRIAADAARPAKRQAKIIKTPKKIGKLVPRLGQGRIIVFGGNALNELSQAMGTLSALNTFVCPVSDETGGPGELAALLNGPSVDDMAQRLLALAADDGYVSRALSRPAVSNVDPARTSDPDLLPLILNVCPELSTLPDPSRRILATCLQHCVSKMQSQRHRHATTTPTVAQCTEGSQLAHFVLCGASCLFQSVEAGAFLMAKLLQVPPETHVLPAAACDLYTRCTIGVRNLDQIVAGQAAIARGEFGDRSEARILYLDQLNHARLVPANAHVLSDIGSSDCIVFGYGSLFSSLLACLAAAGIGNAVRYSKSNKVMIVNGWEDEETKGMTVQSMVHLVVQVLKEDAEMEAAKHRTVGRPRKILAKEFVSHVIVPEDCPIPFDASTISGVGIELLRCPSKPHPDARIVRGRMYDTTRLAHMLRELASTGF